MHCGPSAVCWHATRLREQCLAGRLPGIRHSASFDLRRHTSLRLLFAFFWVNERNSDLSPFMLSGL